MRERDMKWAFALGSIVFALACFAAQGAVIY